MAQISSARSVQFAASDERAEVNELLFKPDHPRAIDRYIDYFGGATEGRLEAADDDTCRDALLERPA